MAPSKAARRVSISAIFKKHQASHKDGKVNKATRSVSMPFTKGHRKTPDHPLVKKFHEQIVISRTEILATSTAALESTHRQFLNRLASTSAQAATFTEDALLASRELTRPLGDERLQFLGKDGRPVGVVLLGERIQWARDVSERLEAELNELWTEWDRVIGDIKMVGEELVGKDVMEKIMSGGIEDVLGHLTGMEEVELNQAKMVEQIEDMCADAVERLVAGEKEMEIKNQKQRQEFLAVLRVD